MCALYYLFILDYSRECCHIQETSVTRPVRGLESLSTHTYMYTHNVLYIEPFLWFLQPVPGH